jgi:putative glutamine amidotransferase
MIIGIPVSTSKTQYYINMSYVDYVEESGLDPVLITPRNNLKAIVAACDGLLLPGGSDLEPTFYGEDNVASYGVDPFKDDFERKVLYAFVEQKKPIFGICRGFQLIAREYLLLNPDEGTWLAYWQHVNKHSLAESLSIPRSVPSHIVDCRADLYGGKKSDELSMFVNSMHHQALISDKKTSPPASKLKIVATTRTGLGSKEKGFVVEAFVLNARGSRILAVQWHPEELRDYRLLQTFFGVKAKETVDVVARVIGE